MVSDLKRLHAPFLAVCAVAAAFAVLDVSLRGALGAAPQWMPPRLYNYVPYFGSRIARIEQLKLNHQVDDRRLVVALGLSSVQHGLDPNVLDQNDPAGRRWLVMGAAGGTLVDLEIAAQPFLDSSLRPDMVVIGIHPWMLHRDDRMAHDTTLAWVGRISWLSKHHDALNSLCIIERDKTVPAVGRLFHLPPWQVYEPAPAPWENQSDFPTEHAPPVEINAQWAGLQFELAPDQYHDNGVELDSFRRLVAHLRGHGRRLVCVLMPETSALRPYPPEVEAAFQRAVASLDEPLEIRDLRTSMPDVLMHDFTHPNSAGRAKFSAMLPGIIH
jgi:hypothetical protein